MKKRQSGGVAGLWGDEEKVLKAVRTLREAGYKNFDTMTPFPVHGMEEAMGIKRSPIPWVTFIFGLIGCFLGLYFQYWTSAVSWPINVGGKPLFSLPAFIPVTFELTILLAALSSVGAMFYFNGLPKINPPIIDKDLTSHKFAIWIPDGSSPRQSREKAEKFLKDLGAEEIKRIEQY